MMNKNYRHLPNPTTQSPSPYHPPLKQIPRSSVSPIKFSPYPTLSPLKSRQQNNQSTTPTRTTGSQRLQLTRSPIKGQENQDLGYMRRTLKNGVGLFQQLAEQNKIGSEKKKERDLVGNASQFSCSEKKREGFGNYQKNSFAALIQNVKEIESMQVSKTNSYYSTQPRPFQTASKPKIQPHQPSSQDPSTQGLILPFDLSRSIPKKQPHPLPQPQPQPQHLQKPPHLPLINTQSIAQVDPEAETERHNVYANAHAHGNKDEGRKHVQGEGMGKQVMESLEDVLLLIRKASEKIGEEVRGDEEEVRMSVEEMSFNMNPFL